MKKGIILIIAVVIIIITSMSYLYLNYKTDMQIAQKENEQFVSYFNQEIYGPDLVTVMNKAMDNNAKNEIQKDNKGHYIENDTNSIKIEIRFLDSEVILLMEDLYRAGTSDFINYYNQIKFKCTKIKYHSNKKVKYMLFEQITQ